jgi:hypothetical protein
MRARPRVSPPALLPLSEVLAALADQADRKEGQGVVRQKLRILTHTFSPVKTTGCMRHKSWSK